MSIENGGAAFPGGEGMSLRDWFAGHALAGLLVGRDFGLMNEALEREIAEKAYDLADAMLTDREALS